MLPAFCDAQAPVPPPAYHRAQVGGRPALHIDALTLVRRLHLLTLCRLAVCYAHWRCPPPLPAGPGGRPPGYAGESLRLRVPPPVAVDPSSQGVDALWLPRAPLALAVALLLARDGRPSLPHA